MIAVVEILYNVLYRLFSRELMNINIGYEFNSKSLYSINELINAIDYIEKGHPTNEEVIKIIQYYEEI